MKQYNFEMKSPSLLSQAAMQRKLFWLEIKNNILQIFSLSTLKIALPAFAFALFMVWGLHSQSIFGTNQSVNKVQYLTKVQQTTQQAESKYYQKYAMLRSIKN